MYLREGGRKISDIALELGYSNPSKFSKAFYSVYIAVFVSNEPSLLPRVMIAVTTDIIGKSRKIKARYPDRKERGLKSDYT